MTDAPKKIVKLTEAQWAEIKATYELGKATKSDLAREYGITRQSMHEGLKARGAVYGCKAKEIEQATIDAERDQAEKRLEDIAAMKERQRQRTELIQNLAVKTITDQMREKKPLGDRKADMAVLRSAMAIISRGREELYTIFDLIRDPDAGDEIPEFIVGEYTDDEIAALNNQRLGITDVDLEQVAKLVENPDADPLEGLLDEEA